MKKAIAISVIVLILGIALFIGWRSQYRYYTAGEGTGKVFLRLNTITGNIMITGYSTRKWTPWVTGWTNK
jgi:hypothetical protein